MGNTPIEWLSRGIGPCRLEFRSAVRCCVYERRPELARQRRESDKRSASRSYASSGHPKRRCDNLADQCFSVTLAAYDRGKGGDAQRSGRMLTHVVEHMATKEDVARLDRRIDAPGAKIDRIDVKLTKFEESEFDKRLQLEVRIAAIEKHLGIDKKIAA
jgi:hypothetical protein